MVVEVDVDKFDISSNKPSDIGRVLSWFSIISQNFRSTFCSPLLKKVLKLADLLKRVFN